jgi:hypothetical protein
MLKCNRHWKFCILKCEGTGSGGVDSRMSIYNGDILGKYIWNIKGIVRGGLGRLGSALLARDVGCILATFRRLTPRH